jgi:hypothetical protein
MAFTHVCGTTTDTVAGQRVIGAKEIVGTTIGQCRVAFKRFLKEEGNVIMPKEWEEMALSNESLLHNNGTLAFVFGFT